MPLKDLRKRIKTGAKADVEEDLRSSGVVEGGGWSKATKYFTNKVLVSSLSRGGHNSRKI